MGSQLLRSTHPDRLRLVLPWKWRLTADRSYGRMDEALLRSGCPQVWAPRSTQQAATEGVGSAFPHVIRRHLFPTGPFLQLVSLVPSLALLTRAND